jgi:hypothetical protein
MAMPVKKSDLGKLEPLAKGGFGEVFRVGGNPIPGDETPLAYKEFSADHETQRRSVRAAVAFRERLSRVDRDDLDQCTVWPRELVIGPDGKISGLLMQLIPDDFFCELLDPETATKTRKVRDIQWLATSQAQRDAAEVDLREIEQLERLILLGRLVYAVGRLHKHRWVFGDLSFKNAAFALNPPRMMLLDCDGAAALTDGERKQPSTPNWDAPECPIIVPAGQRRQQDVQDDVTDVYKLGLAILRCLSPGKGAMSSRNPSRLDGLVDDAGRQLVGRALGDRDQRPTAKELYAYFYAVVSPAVRPPRVEYARLATPLCVRGMDARIEWRLANADKITVASAGADEQTVDLSSHPDGYTIEAPRSGPVRIEVTNKFGTLPINLGNITLYQLPPFTPFSPGTLPRPVIPRVAEFSLEHLRPVLDAVPAIGMPQVPAIPPAPTQELVGSFRDAFTRALPLPLPNLSEAVAKASRAIVVRTMNEALEYAAASGRNGLAEPPAAGDDTE